MSRRYGVSLGALAMGVVVFRGVIRGELAVSVAAEAISAGAVFVAVGMIAGRIADYLIRNALETRFRNRVDWYRQGLIDQQTDNSNGT